MKITDRRKEKVFEALTIGDVFSKDSCIYLKLNDSVLCTELEDYLVNDNIYEIDDIDNECYIYNAINLITNNFCFFHPNDKITELPNAELKVE